MTYDARGRERYTRSGFHLDRNFSFSIQGDLSREEAKDIRKAIRTIQRATRDLTSPDAEKAADKAADVLARLDKLDTIDRLDAKIEVKREVARERVAKSPDSQAFLSRGDSPDMPPDLPPDIVLPDNKPVTVHLQ
jgi:hypothetical protein